MLIMWKVLFSCFFARLAPVLNSLSLEAELLAAAAAAASAPHNHQQSTSNLSLRSPSSEAFSRNHNQSREPESAAKLDRDHDEDVDPEVTAHPPSYDEQDDGQAKEVGVGEEEGVDSLQNKDTPEDLSMGNCKLEQEESRQNNHIQRSSIEN